MDNNVLIAFAITLIAGLSTSIGSLISFFVKDYKGRFLPISLGFSAGVMIYVGLVELYQDSSVILTNAYGEKLGSIFTLFSFFLGIVLIFFIDKLVPDVENPHSMLDKSDEKQLSKNYKKNFFRIGILTAIAITVHNFPEGIATFASSLNDLKLGIGIAIAIAIHNIPEGIAVSVPIYVATKSRKKALLYSSLSGFTEFIGALFAYIVLGKYLNSEFLAVIYSMVAGIMVYISLDELLPASKKYGKHHDSIIGIVLGMMVMGISLIIIN